MRFKDTATESGQKNAFAIGMVIQLTLVIVVVGILALMGIYIAEKVSDKTALQNAAAATGTYTFSGNVSNGELVNITNGAAIYRFEFNTTGNGTNTNAVLTANAIRINLSMEADGLNIRNTSVLASGNLTAAINANTSTAALVTAANTTNVTTLTADNTGTGANTISLADNAANVASSGMSGGVDIDTFKNASDDTVDAIETGFDFLEIIILAIVAGIVILAIFSYIPIRL